MNPTPGTRRTPIRFALAVSALLAPASAAVAGDNPLDPEPPAALPRTTPALNQAIRDGRAGNVHAMMVAGTTLYNGRTVVRDCDTAARWFQKAAAAGNPYAMENLGVAAEDGHGLPQDDAVALGWFRKGSDANLGRSDRKVAYYTQTGRGGVTADPPAAVKLYRKAVNDGFTPACSDLGFCYDHGVGVAKDLPAAAQWFRHGAEAGDVDAMRNLATYLHDGIGGPADPVEAARWQAKAKAAEDGTPPAADPAPAATPGTAKDLVGTWAVTSPAVRGHPTVEFVDGGSVTIRDPSGGSSTMGGKIWSYAGGAITFNGGASVNGLDVSGTWMLRWAGPTEFTTADADGHPMTLRKQ